MTPSENIDIMIENFSADWRGKELTELRKSIHKADPAIKEDWKWNTAVFTHNGNVCALGSFKDHLKINFFNGASLADPDGLFNAGLEAKVSRAIDLFEGDKIDQKAFERLVRQAAGN